MTRRHLLDRRRLLLGAGPAAATIAVAGLAGHATVAEGTSASSYAPTFFTAAEWAFVKAAVGRLIPSEGAGPGGIETGIPEFIDRQMELPYGHGAYFYLTGPFLSNTPPALGYQLRHTPREIYRLGIAAANAAAQQQQGEAFAALAVADQDRFLERMEKDALQFASMPASVVFAQLLGDAKEGYFADPLYGGNRGMAAWKWIGFPGARADFTDWLDQAGRAYPYGPVSISGARG
jgi:gluconate 2-dehydrogenase gamma chain